MAEPALQIVCEPPPHTRKTLDAAYGTAGPRACACGQPDCQSHARTIFVRARCHPEAGVRVTYVLERGYVHLGCAQCLAGIARIQVAWGLPE